MNNTNQINIFLSIFTTSLPTLIVCLVAGVVIITKRRQVSSGSLWALLGFSLAIILCFVVPLGQTLLQYWVSQSGERESRIWAFRTFSTVVSLLHAIIYVFLLLAILAGRSQSDDAISPSSDRP